MSLVNTGDWFAKEDRDPPRCIIVDSDGLNPKTLRKLKRVVWRGITLILCFKAPSRWH